MSELFVEKLNILFASFAGEMMDSVVLGPEDDQFRTVWEFVRSDTYKSLQNCWQDDRCRSLVSWRLRCSEPRMERARRGPFRPWGTQQAGPFVKLITMLSLSWIEWSWHHMINKIVDCEAA